jgi:hypothetical protein
LRDRKNKNGEANICFDLLMMSLEPSLSGGMEKNPPQKQEPSAQRNAKLNLCY